MEKTAQLVTQDNKKIRIAIVTNIIPGYRADFYNYLALASDFRFTVFCQDAIPGSGIDNIVSTLPLEHHKVNYVGAEGERIGLQILPILKLLREFDGYLILGNPRVLSNPIISILLLILRKPVAIWGQAHTANSHPFLEKIRLSWWRLFQFIFLYNDHEVQTLRQSGFEKHVLAAMNNGLDQKIFDRQILSNPEASLIAWKHKNNISNRLLVLSCSRLTEKNSFHEVINALPSVRERYPSVLWCIIGDGPKKESLAKAIRNNNLENHVLWVGRIYDEQQLAPWFLSSTVMVHPEGVGLSLLHAFGYGLPVITSNNPHSQMPEFYALQDGVNGLLYTPKDPNSLAKRMCRILGDAGLRAELSKNALSTVRYKYNTKIMSENLLGLLRRMTDGNKTNNRRQISQQR